MLLLHDIHSSEESSASEDSDCGRERHIHQECRARKHCLPTGVNNSEKVLLITNIGGGGRGRGREMGDGGRGDGGQGMGDGERGTGGESYRETTGVLFIPFRG